MMKSLTMMKSQTMRMAATRWVLQPRTEIERLMVFSSLFSCLLIILRILHTGSLSRVFMIWNLFLAYIPYAISKSLTRRRNRRIPDVGQPAPDPRTPGAGAVPGLASFVEIILSFVWLLFIPNSFYILTDLFHLPEGSSQVPLWFDLVMLLSFAWNGLLLGILSIRQMEKLFSRLISSIPEWLFIYGIMWLNAWGVYIGRYLRYNSWDIVFKPMGLLNDILSMVLHPVRFQTNWGMVFCWSILLTLMYQMIKKMAKAFN